MREPLRLHMKVLWLLSCFFIVGGSPFVRPSAMLAVPFQEQASRIAIPDDSILISVAAAIAEAAQDLAAIWPGYWPTEQPFAVADIMGSGAVVAVVTVESIPGFDPITDVPAVLRGRVFYRAEGLPGAQPGILTAKTVPLGSGEGYVQPVIIMPGHDYPVHRRTSLVLHEAFHVYQREGGFAPGESISGLVPIDFLRDTTFVSDPGFLEQIRRENSLLAQVAQTSEMDSMRTLLRKYLTVRANRLEGRPDLARVERHYERQEGTAEFVGCQAAGAVATSEHALQCLTDELEEDAMEMHPMRGGPLGYLSRWRLYDTGAVLASALDRLKVEGWRDRIAAGDPIDMLISEAVLK